MSAHITSHVFKPGESRSMVALGSAEPRPMICAVWPDIGIGSAAPTEAELALLSVAVFIDQSQAPTMGGGYNQGMQVAMPAAGLRRVIAAQQMNIVVTLSKLATKSIPVRAHACFGVESTEELTGSVGVAIEGFQFYTVPRFATRWRAWDWSGGATLDFRDFTGANSTLPQGVAAGSHSEWTPLPPGAALVLASSSNMALQFGRG